jgi:hypothetical protein
LPGERAPGLWPNFENITSWIILGTKNPYRIAALLLILNPAQLTLRMKGEKIRSQVRQKLLLSGKVRDAISMMLNWPSLLL